MENLYLMKKAIYLLHHVNSMLRYRKSPISVSVTINTLLCVLNLKSLQVHLKTNTLYFCCRDVFTAWVSSRQGSNQFTVK